MDFSYLSNLSQDKHPKANNGFDRKRQVLPPASKRQSSGQVASSAVQLFLARKQQEEKQKYEEFRKKKEELLSLRAQNSKSNKKAKLMASRTRDNDFSKIKLTEDEEEAKVKREKELQQKGLRNKVDRMKARIELEERDNQLPRKRKRKSHLPNSDEPLNVNSISTNVKIEHHINCSDIHQKNDMERKISKHKPKPAPVMDYKDLLQVAAKKQYEPIALSDEDFEEESDEYEEENKINITQAENFPLRNSERPDSLKEDRTLSKQHNSLNKNRIIEKARLNHKSSDNDEYRQNKENAYKCHNRNANIRPHKLSGERDKNTIDGDRSNTSLSQKHAQRNDSDSVALHAKENKTTYSSEMYSSKKISHSSNSKPHYVPTDKNSVADVRSTSTSKQDSSIYMSRSKSLCRENPKKPEVHSQNKTKHQNQPNHTLSPIPENNYSEVLEQKRKHEQTFKNSIKGVSDRKINSHHTVALSSKHSRNDQKGITSMATHNQKKDNETTLNIKNNHSSAEDYRKIESSRSFKIPKKNSNNTKLLDNDTPCYYTDEGSSNTLDEVKQAKNNKMAFTKAPNLISKSSKSSSREMSQEHLSYKEKESKSHNSSSTVSEKIIKNKHKSDTLNLQQRTDVKEMIQRCNDKLKEKFSQSKTTERSSSNRSAKVSNSNEYFTEEGQEKVQCKSTIESNSTKDRMKSRNEFEPPNEVCQYFTEQFTTGKSEERNDDLKYRSHRKNDNSEQDKSKIKHKRHEHSPVVNKRPSEHYDVKPYKREKTTLDQPQYFTEDFAADGNNAAKTNHKFHGRTPAPQKEKQMKHSQYFTEHYAADENNNSMKSSEQDSKYDKKINGHQKERNIKQPQYFTESFENNTVKDNERNCKYDKRTTVTQKQSQYFTENFTTDEKERTKSSDRSCKHDKRTSIHQKERQTKEPQYFTEHFVTSENNTRKNSDSDCKYEKKFAMPQKESQVKQNHYFTENFSKNERNTTKNKDNVSNYTTKTKDSNHSRKPQKDKQIDDPQYFTEDFVANEGSKTNKSDSYKYERTAMPQKERKPQYFTESYSENQNSVKYKQERNATMPHTEKPKQFHNNANVAENVSKKVISKENCYKKVSNVASHTSNSHAGIHKKPQKDDQTHSCQSKGIRVIPKRPREQSEDEPHPSKICKYESATNSEVDTSNFKREKPLINHSRERSKTSLSHSESKFEKNKHITKEIDSFKKNDAIRSQAHTLKPFHSKQKIHEQEKTAPSSHSNAKLKDHCEKLHTSELSSPRKPDRKVLPSREKLLPPNNSSFAKQALPNKAKKIIPASSMAQMMNKKPLQSMPHRETVGAKIQNVNHESSKPKKLLESSIDAKRTAQQRNLGNPPIPREKLSSGIKDPPKQINSDSKFVVNQKKVISSSQRTANNSHNAHQKSHVDNAHQKSRVDNAHHKNHVDSRVTHRNVIKKPKLNQDRKMRQEEYDSKIRNRFSRPSPRMFIKRNVDSDEEEEEEDDEDDDMSDFIDDDPIEEDEEDYSRYIREIFGYDKRRYRFEEDLDDRDMETSYAQQMKEERRSARIGYLEDLEDMRKEEEEKKKKLKKQK